MIILNKLTGFKAASCSRDGLRPSLSFHLEQNGLYSGLECANDGAHKEKSGRTSRMFCDLRSVLYFLLSVS